MNVLVTGGAGFIGSHLAEAMLESKHRVTVVDDLSTGSLANLANLEGRPDFRFFHQSVLDSSALAPRVGECDVIVHLAAAVGVRLIVEDPVHTLQTNIHGTEILLELAQKFGRKIFLASSSEVYGKSTARSFSEDDDTIQGSTRSARWSYACSKRVDEFLALAYHDQFGLETIIGRFFNAIGPRQIGRYGMVVPRFVGRALRGEPLDVYGTGEQTRSFTHVQDIVSAIGQLLQCPEAIGEVVNIGSDETISIHELAETIIELTGSKSEIRLRSYEEVYGHSFDDMMVRQPNLAKIRGLIGYEPQFNLDQTLRGIIDWKRRNPPEVIPE